MDLGRPNFGRISSVVLLVLALNVLVMDCVRAATGSGLQFTQEEVSIWRERAANGPYKTAGDVNPNSPGDWDRIKRNADAFVANPSADRWDGGYAGGGCVPKWSESPHNPFRIRDAAFVYLVTRENKYREAVRNELLNYYVPHKLMDFSNRSRWCLGSNSLNDISPGFGIAEAMTRILFAYDYIKSTLTPSEQKRINEWLMKAGEYFRQNLDQALNNIYSDRKDGIFNNSSAMASSESSYPVKKTHEGGYDISTVARNYNNRRAAMASFLADVGVLINDERMINSAKTFFKEWMKYGVFPDGTHNEYYRSSVDRHEKGFAYSMSTIYHMMAVADVMARAGDESLYKYTTSEGLAQTRGGNKNLLLVIQNMCRYLDRTFKRYLQGKGGQESYRMDGREGNSWVSLFDIYFSISNIYYKDDYIKSIYLRKQAGTDPYPTKPATAGPWQVWQGTGGTLPGVLFMFGQMEGKVWPYGGSATELQRPSTPATPRIEKH